MRRAVNKVAWVLAGALAVGTVPPVWAQPVPVPPPGVAMTLLEAVTLALRRNSSILVAQTVVRGNEGLLQAAGGAFDPRLSGSAEVLDDGVTTQRTLTTSNSVERLMRSGVLVGVGLDSSGQRPASPGVFQGSGTSSTLALSLTFPLLRGRGTEVTTAQENIQRLALSSSEYTLRDTTSQQILATAQAYWRLRAAQEALSVQREAEARAVRQVADTRRLIDAGEQPAANINLAQATQSTRGAARIEAERALAEARLALDTLVGVDLGQARVGEAIDPFPAAAGGPVDAAELDALVSRALAQRADLMAAQASLDALRVAMLAANDNLKPILNAGVQLGYSGSTRGDNPLNVFGRSAGERQVTAGIRYQWDVYNNDAKGRLVKASADHDQQALGVEALKRAIVAGVSNAAVTYNSARAQLLQSGEMVELYRRAVEGERSKLRLGSATLLDVVNIETTLQQAQLSHINAMAAYAAAVANLRYQAGELVPAEGQTQLLPIERLRQWRTPAPVLAPAPAR